MRRFTVVYFTFPIQHLNRLWVFTVCNLNMNLTAYYYDGNEPTAKSMALHESVSVHCDFVAVVIKQITFAIISKRKGCWGLIL